MKKYIISGIIVGVLLAVVYFGFILKVERMVGGALSRIVATDLIGTRVGSSTTPVNFYVFASASTTYPFRTGEAKSATISFGVTEASSSAAVVDISILGSNDSGCETATTSTIFNILTKSEVRWFDASPNFKGASAPTAITKATTTLHWANPDVDAMKEIVLTDLNTECLAVHINASSTKVWAQYRLKE